MYTADLWPYRCHACAWVARGGVWGVGRRNIHTPTVSNQALHILISFFYRPHISHLRVVLTVSEDPQHPDHIIDLSSQHGHFLVPLTTPACPSLSGVARGSIVSPVLYEKAQAPESDVQALGSSSGINTHLRRPSVDTL